MVDALVLDDAVETVRHLLAQERLDEAAAYIRGLHPADAAEVLARLTPEERLPIVRRLSPEELAHAFDRMDEDDMAAIAQQIGRERLVDVLERMEPDAAADLLGEMPATEQATLLAEMADADEVAPLLEYPPDTAGGIMNRVGPMLRRHMTVAEALEFLRQHYQDERELYYLYVLDRYGRLVGVVSLRGLILANPEQRVEEIMNPDVITVQANMDQEEVARLLSRYDFLALPVVDEENRLLGIVTVDDVLDVLEEEATEDIYRLAQVSEHSQVFSPIRQALANRLPWLVVNLFTAFLASGVVSLFEGTIARAAVLATFMPIVAGQGGNAGTQTMTIMVRSLALGELDVRDMWRALRYEIQVGLLNGLAVGTLVGLVAWAWKANPVLGAVIAVAMIGNMLAAAVAGVVVPLTLKVLRVDPALASSIFVTTVTDVCGFLFFLGLGSMLLL
ncbi:MAG: magnesium transporter [Ardenticatenia bacterium]|nr:magnesium transporter [Ardenticatenia bacterium]